MTAQEMDYVATDDKGKPIYCPKGRTFDPYPIDYIELPKEGIDEVLCDALIEIRDTSQEG